MVYLRCRTGTVSSFMNKILVAGGQVIIEGLHRTCLSLTLIIETRSVVAKLLLCFFFVFSGLEKHLHFLSRVMSAPWSCGLVQYMNPTELHTAFSHSTAGTERQTIQHCNTFATCQWGFLPVVSISAGH